MIVEHKFYIGLRDIGKDNCLSNKGLLSALEDAGCKHSEIAGLGITNINVTNKSWVILYWKVKIYFRPKFNSEIIVKTWSRKMDKLYAYRDFEVVDENNNKVAIGTSKWILLDYNSGKIVKLSEDISNDYDTENKTVFEKDEEIKLDFKYSIKNRICYRISKNLIDLNHHLNNVNYLDLATEILEESIDNYDEFEILYKKQIMLNEEVYIYNCMSGEDKYIIISDEEDNIDLKKVRAIIKLR